MCSRGMSYFPVHLLVCPPLLLLLIVTGVLKFSIHKSGTLGYLLYSFAAEVSAVGLLAVFEAL